MSTDWSQLHIAVLGPFPPRPGGVSVQCALLAEHLQAAGAGVVRINSDVPRLRRAGRAGRLLLPIAQVGSLLWQMFRSRGRWQVLHVHAASWWGFMPVVVGWLAGRGRRRVLSYHGGEAAAFLRRYHWLVRPLLRRYHAVLTLTPTQDAIFARYGIKALIVPNIVPVERFHFRHRHRLAPRILWLRQLEARYRPHDALEVLRRVQTHVPSATLTMVGGGQLQAELAQYIHRLKLSGVRLYGPAQPHEISRLYDEADIFLNTSAIDNLPLTLIEASASGLPIVSTRAGAIPDLITDGRDGLLAPVGDVEQLTHHILTLLQQPELAQRLSAAAAANAARFTWSRVAPQLAQVYFQAAKAPVPLENTP